MAFDRSHCPLYPLHGVICRLTAHPGLQLAAGCLELSHMLEHQNALRFCFSTNC